MENTNSKAECLHPLWQELGPKGEDHQEGPRREKKCLGAPSSLSNCSYQACHTAKADEVSGLRLRLCGSTITSYLPVGLSLSSPCDCDLGEKTRPLSRWQIEAQRSVALSCASVITRWPSLAAAVEVEVAAASTGTPPRFTFCYEESRLENPSIPNQVPAMETLQYRSHVFI